MPMGDLWERQQNTAIGSGAPQRQRNYQATPMRDRLGLRARNGDLRCMAGPGLPCPAGWSEHGAAQHSRANDAWQAHAAA